MLRNIPSIIFIVLWYHVSLCFKSCAGQEFAYPGQAKSERDLSICKPYEVCSIVHKRFWFPNEVERFCRCDQQECSTSWADFKDNSTMMLNNRSQMKFCEPLNELPNCLQNNTKFLHVVNETRIEQYENKTRENYKITSHAECFCPPHNTWIPHAYQREEKTTSISKTSYRCSELPRCSPRDFCGFERTDFYSNYYKCSCPTGYLCVRETESTNTSIVNEIFYAGAAYKAYCTSFPLTINFSDQRN